QLFQHPAVLAVAVHQCDKRGTGGMIHAAQYKQGTVVQNKRLIGWYLRGDGRAAFAVVGAALHITGDRIFAGLQVHQVIQDHGAAVIEVFVRVILLFVAVLQQAQRFSVSGIGLCSRSFSGNGGGTFAAVNRGGGAARQQQGGKRQRKNAFHPNILLL